MQEIVKMSAHRNLQIQKFNEGKELYMFISIVEQTTKLCEKFYDLEKLQIKQQMSYQFLKNLSKGLSLDSITLLDNKNKKVNRTRKKPREDIDPIIKVGSKLYSPYFCAILFLYIFCKSFNPFR